MTRHVQGGVEGYGNAAVKTYRRIENAVEIAKRDAALRLIVDEEAQCVRGVQVEEDADGRALLDAALGALRVTAAVHEPRPLPVYVHAPALVVLTCEQDDSRNCASLPSSFEERRRRVAVYPREWQNERWNVRNKDGPYVRGNIFEIKNKYICMNYFSPTGL